MGPGGSAWSDGSPARFVVRLFGDADIRLDGCPVEAFGSLRLQSLLAYLVVGRDTTLSRRRIAFLLWPDSTEGQARTNLRQALHHLRQALPDLDRHLRVENQTLQWLADSPASVDIVEFEAAVRSGLAIGDPGALRRAVALYRGDLLEGCYDDWIAPERERLRNLAVGVLTRLVDIATETGDLDDATRHAEHLLRLDPLDESAYRRVMQLQVATGNRTRALRTYHTCVSTLERELGVEPDGQTMAAYDRIMAEGTSALEPVAHRPRRAEQNGGVSLIGRDDELNGMIDVWRVSAAGQPRFLLVSGEPGVGKSHLVEHLREWCSHQGASTVWSRAYQAEGDVPYGPVVDVLRSEALRSSLVRMEGVWRRELARLLPELADVPAELAVAFGSADSARQRLFEAVALAVVPADRPLLWAIDDLQWCDAETLDFVDFAMRFATKAGSPLLVVATVREEEMAGRPQVRTLVNRLYALDTVVELRLPRLASKDAEALATLLLAGKANKSIVEQLVEGSEGNPLFLVEMARSGLIERGHETAVGVPALPPRLRSVIENRLDQLSAPAHDLAAVAAVVGRAFTIDVLSRLVPDQDTVVGAVDELWRRGIIRERGVDGYDFSHDKIREVAYLTTGPGRRRQLHAAVAAALQAESSMSGDEMAAQIANHFDRAGQSAAAIDYYRRAVSVAARVFAHHDVIGHCRAALRLVGRQPPGPVRDDLELGFLVPLGVAIMSGPGMTRADIHVYERANTLRAQRGRPPEPSTVRLTANFHINYRNYTEARRLGELLLARGQQESDPVVTTEGYYVVGVTSFWLGDLASSRQHLEDALRSNRAEHLAVHLEHYGQDPHTICLVRLGVTMFYSGDDIQASTLCEDALIAATDTGHSYTETYARMFVGWYLSESGSIGRAAQLAQGADPSGTNRVAAVCRPMLRGWHEVALGDIDSGLQLLDDALREANGEVWEPMVLIYLARAHGLAGDPATGLARAQRAHTIATNEMPFYLPEAARLSGELMLRCGADPKEAIARLREAAAVAACHGNVVHELRARTVLLETVRRHDQTSVTPAEQALKATCDSLPVDSQLAEVRAARAALASPD